MAWRHCVANASGSNGWCSDSVPPASSQGSTVSASPANELMVQQARIVASCSIRPSSSTASPPAISSPWLRATATSPCGVTSKVTTATWAAGSPSRSIGGAGSFRLRGRADHRAGSRRPSAAIRSRRHSGPETALPPPASPARHDRSSPTREVVTIALAPMRPSAAIKSARRQSSGRGAAIMPARSTPRMVSTSSTVFGSCTRDHRVGGKAEPAQPRGDRRHDAVGLGIGQPARLAVGEVLAVGRVGKRDRHPAGARRCGGRWHRALRRPRPGESALAIAQDHGRACGHARSVGSDATRFPADSRTARSLSGARSWSSARPIARADGTAARDRSPTSARGRARAPPRRSPRARAP